MKKLSLLSFFKSSNKNTMPKLVSGFTLVELLVTITIFVIVTGVVLVNSNQFDSSVLLNNFAYDVALTIRQAQSYGVNVSESTAGSFNSFYGVFFDTSKSKINYGLFDYTPTTLDPTSEFLSVISNADITAVCSLDNNCLQKYTMGRGTFIKSICVSIPNNTSCADFDGKLVIMFQRPKLGAIIVPIDNSPIPIPRDYVEITLAVPSGATSTVVVTSIGQIYVKK